MNIIQIFFICILLFIIAGISYQYQYDSSHCKPCLENMTNYTYDLYNQISSLKAIPTGNLGTPSSVIS